MRRCAINCCRCRSNSRPFRPSPPLLPAPRCAPILPIKQRLLFQSAPNAYLHSHQVCAASWHLYAMMYRDVRLLYCTIGTGIES